MLLLLLQLYTDDEEKRRNAEAEDRKKAATKLAALATRLPKEPISVMCLAEKVEGLGLGLLCKFVVGLFPPCKDREQVGFRV